MVLALCYRSLRNKIRQLVERANEIRTWYDLYKASQISMRFESTDKLSKEIGLKGTKEGMKEGRNERRK